MKKGFSIFINKCLKILLLLVVFVTYGLYIRYVEYYKSLNMEVIALFSLTTIALLIAIKKGFSTRRILMGIMIFAFLIRLAWILSINSVPVSDFAGMYERSELVLNGEYSIFKGFNYYARFPHLTIPVLYFALIRFISSIPLLTLKLINVISSTIGVFICYKISKEIFKEEKKTIWGMYLAAIYPATIIYTAAYCTENIAISFYLGSVYLFILVIKDKKPKEYLLLAGLILSIGNFFRMVASVIVIAFILYTLVYIKKSFKYKTVAIAYILIAFIIPLVTVNATLKELGITEYNLWHGSETPWTSILKGTNMTTFGRWNEEDAEVAAAFNGNYYETEHAAKELVKERYTETSPGKLLYFLGRKFTVQWSEGDFGGIYWSERDIEPKDITIDLNNYGQAYRQLFYLIMMVLTYKGLYNRQQYLKNPIINLLYIIYCGYGLLYMITESQDRYSFIVSWLFIILPLTAFKEKSIEGENI
ncbi:glycosyltransferase family 39 protein [Clostridium sp. YIM B02551]|uniref:glycosyltransferase family 39 protein n=1 Tax=Clostridium sp. YIM B02551 TaxID=2910679 RepID=UPI001EEB59EE